MAPFFRKPRAGTPDGRAGRPGGQAGHEADLVLATAAGQRVDAAWRTIQGDYGPRVIRILTQLPLADFTPEELWAETLAHLMADDPAAAPLPDGRLRARIAKYQGRASLLDYLVLVARRLAVSRQRRLRPTDPLGGSDAEREQVDLVDRGSPSPETLIRSDQSQENLEHTIVAAYRALTANQQELVAMVFRDGMKQKDAGARLGWSEFKTSRQMSAALDRLRDAAERLGPVTWNTELAHAWRDCLSVCWRDVPRS